MDIASVAIERLDRTHDRARFTSGIPALDRYLTQQARQDADKRVAAPFVAVRPPERQVLGFYTLSASVLMLTDLPAQMAHRLPRYPQLPVTLLGRLAVDRGCRGQGLGEHLLLDALHRTLVHAEQIAAMAVVVDAKDDMAAAFYRHYGFLALQANPQRLYLPMGTVAALFA
ncbi:MAG: GNAT family N-acetyltransferase [Burkholderiaceae bacterium]|nr:GNAT family N-acetyltransferase [Burkholderiaceae bacterium]